jgi:hypothetical protein
MKQEPRYASAVNSKSVLAGPEMSGALQKGTKSAVARGCQNECHARATRSFLAPCRCTHARTHAQEVARTSARNLGSIESPSEMFAASSSSRNLIPSYAATRAESDIRSYDRRGATRFYLDETIQKCVVVPLHRTDTSF